MHTCCFDSKGRILASGSVERATWQPQVDPAYGFRCGEGCVILQNNDWVKSVKKEGDSIIVEAPENKTAAINESAYGKWYSRL